MSTQYDTIGASYNEIKKLPAAQVESYNFHKAAAPYAKGAKVLDLACGTGQDSGALLAMGAASVVGVDISRAMIEVAEASLSSLSTSDKLRFQIGDCSKPVVFDGGPFDLVVGSWLLNYAPSAEEMTDMFRTVAMNLRDGGHFLAVTPHPTNDPRDHIERGASARPVQYGNITTFATADVEDGIATHLVAAMRPENVEFDAYHLRKDIYERCAREGGLEGELVWKPTELPAGEDAVSWKSYLEVPHFGILDVSKD